MKKHQNSNLEQVLTIGDGGLSDQKQPPPPLPSLAPEDIQKQSSALAQQEPSKVYILRGSQPLNSGDKPVLTERSGSTIPNSTLAGTVNWVLKMLQGRGLIRFSLSANGKNYRAMFSTSLWKFENGVLTLKNDVSTIAPKEDTK